MNKNQVVIKVFGELQSVKATVQKIESLYPIYIEGKIQFNDQDSGVHLFLTVPVEPKEYDILDGLKRARQAAEKEDKNGFGYTPQESAKTATATTHNVIEAAIT